MAAESASPNERDARRRVSADTVVQGVIRLIHTRHYQPGERVREQELADRFGVSRGPVREALRILEAKGILRIEPMRGATVARLSDDETYESVEVAAVLFGLAARHAAKRATEAQKRALLEAAEKLASLSDTDVAPRAFFLETVKLGQHVVDASHTGRLNDLLIDVRMGWPNILGPLGFTTKALRRRAAAKWGRLAKAVDAGDGAAAERLAAEVHYDVMAEAKRVGW